MAIVESFDHLGPNFKMHVCAKFTRVILNSFLFNAYSSWMTGLLLKI